MSSAPNEAPRLEIAHVLFADIVGYSRLPVDKQAHVLRQLNGVVRATEEFRRAEAAQQLIRLPTGDGMALVFFGDPQAALRCAIEISRALGEQPSVPLRMGVHSGLVYRMDDINTSMNVAGAGINMAQRVMDCGDAGHILASEAVADTLGQVTTWAGCLHDLGEAEVKHGVRVRIFNVHGDGYGNPSPPSRLQEPTPAPAPPPVVPAPPPSPVIDPAQKPRVALLYKRHAQPDEQLLATLEAMFREQGCSVFIDRHLSIGIEWAQEIERQVCGADAVIPLLSAASVNSEMLAYEVQTAHTAAQNRQGKPRLLPVRVAFKGPLPDVLGAILNPLQYADWQSPADDQRLTEELLESLRNPPPSRQIDLRKLEPVGGAVPLDSKFYIVRPTDDEFLTAIERRDSIVLVKGARQMGKTSLLARGLRVARETGAKVALTDFQGLNSAHFESAGALYLTLAEMIADQLNLDVMPEDVWREDRGPSVNFQRYIRREVLAKVPGHLVWGLDEVDRLFTCPFGSEVFGLFRSWHNARSLDPEGPWRNLTMAIAYATEAHLFISDLNQSPFNVGTRLTLDDFNPGQVAELNRRYNSPLKDQTELETFHALVSGQPYLVRRGLHEMAAHRVGIDSFAALAARDEGPFGDHLRRFLVLLAQDSALCNVAREILRDGTCPTTESFYRLRSAGLLSGDSVRDARLRCQLYKDYLSRHLL